MDLDTLISPPKRDTKRKHEINHAEEENPAVENLTEWKKTFELSDQFAKELKSDIENEFRKDPQETKSLNFQDNAYKKIAARLVDTLYKRYEEQLSLLSLHAAQQALYLMIKFAKKDVTRGFKREASRRARSESKAKGTDPPLSSDSRESTRSAPQHDLRCFRVISEPLLI